MAISFNYGCVKGRKSVGGYIKKNMYSDSYKDILLNKQVQDFKPIYTMK